MTVDETVHDASSPAGFVRASDEELGDLRASAARVLEAAPPSGSWDRTRWRRMAELGWFALIVPEDRGGAGAGPDVAAALAGCFGRATAAEPLVAGAALPAAWLSGLPSTVAADEILTAIGEGTGVAAAAWQPEDGALDGADVPVQLTAGPADGVTLTGRAWWVAVADADVYLVLAHRDGEPQLVACPADAEGLSRVPLELADGSHCAHLDLVDVQLSSGAVLASGPQVLEALTAAIDLALVLTAAELTGLAERALDLTLEHLRTRHQFGRPLGSFQSAQHAAVDMYTQVRLSAAALAAAIREWERPDATARDRAAAASSAKVRASIAARHVTTKAVHLHGALGFSDEYALGRTVNRGLVLASFLGNAELHRRRHQRLTEPGGGTAA